ncbi:MAG: aspartate carbamoyltransferase catalytic subunit [Acidimicrobiales bacterium]
MTADDLRRATWRMAHEIVERNHGLDGVVLVALQTGGVPIAEALAAALLEIEGVDVPVGSLDVAFYRDDIGLRPVLPEAVTDIAFAIDGAVVVLVDDVLFTGRTIRAALNARRLRPGPRRAAGGDGRPGPSRAAHPARLRGQEPAHPARRGRRRGRRRRGPRRDGEVKHLLAIDELGADGIAEIHRLADAFVEVNRRPIPKVPTLRGRTVVSLFFEDSTRTRLSFETAAKRLSADTMTFSVGTSSVKKGESVRDTIETIEAMGIDAIVVRHGSAGVPWQIARWSSAAVINAGDGWHQHPTQALLDTYTALGHLGSLDGRRVAIVGDIKHSRVARSNIAAFTLLGAEVVLVAPRTLLPPDLTDWPVRVVSDLDSVLGDVDVLYLLRMQRERMTESLVPSLREYARRFGLDRERAARLGDGAIVMHPGPMNRGVEIAGDITELPNVVVTEQVANGVAVRMAVLFWLLGADPVPTHEEEPADA